MKERIGRVGARGTGNKLPKFAGRARFALVMIALVTLCTSVVAQENTAEDWFNKGYELFHQESFKESLDALDKAIEIDPQHFDSWLYKGFTLSMIAQTSRGQEGPKAFEESLKAYDKAIEISPRNATAWMIKGGTLDSIAHHMTYDFNMVWSKKDSIEYFNQSLQAFDKAIELSPQDANSWNGKSVTLYHLGRYLEIDAQMGKDKGVMGIYKQALQAVDKAIEIDPKTDGAQESKAILLSVMGQYNESTQAYEGAIEKANSTQELARAWSNKANIFRAQGKNDEAILAFNKAFELDPHGPDGLEALTDKGATLLVMGRLNESLEAFDEATIDSNNVEAWLNKGLVLREMGRYNDSLDAYEEALKLDPNNSLVSAGKSATLKALGRASK
jgi:tetratricopeptide (TPR) repeat protein